MGTLREVTGLVLLTVGVIGLIVPVIPGIPLLLGAAALLGPDHPKIRPWMERIQQWRNLGRKHGT